MKRRRAALNAVVTFEILGVLASIPLVAKVFSSENTLKTLLHSYNPILDILSIVVGVVSIFFLFHARHAFPARLGRRNWSGAIVVTLIGLGVTILLAGVFGNIQASRGSGDAWRNALDYLLSGVGLHLPGHHPEQYFLSKIFQEMMELSYAACVLLFILMVLRNPPEKNVWTPETELELRELVHTYGANDSLSYFATRRDKLIVFSDDRKAAVTYRLIRSVCLASGDPVGAPSSWASAIANFTQYARTYGWNLGAMSVSEEGAKAYAAAGLSITYMGDEAILYPDRFSLNFAMFRKTFVEADHFGASPWTRAASSTLGFLDRYLQLERLYRFNQKFDPFWQPRYLAAESIVTLPSVAIASGIAEGFLPEWLSRKTTTGGTLTDEQLKQALEVERHTVAPAPVEHRFTDQSKHRIRHMKQLREAGMNPYPLGISTQLTPAQLAEKIATFENAAGSGASTGERLSVAGRARAIRSFGSVVFVELIDGATTVQVVCERERFEASGADLDLLRHNADTGDILVFEGVLGRSKNGTASLLASSWFMGAKSLHAIPFENFKDPEARLRRRSTDLIVNPRQREFLKMRASIITSIRATLDGEAFTEVETPILNSIHGGASARPFKTFINAYGAELYLRIAPELYLKRLVVGDMGAVYELGRDFRNEGADATHNPEFTVLEAYKPFSDYNGMREITESLIKNAARSVFGTESLPLGEKGADERTLTDVSGPWPVKTVCGALSEAVGIEISLDTDFEVLLKLARENEIYVRDDMGAGAIIEELYGELVEANTIFPTFYKDFPVETSPLAGPHRSEKGLAERWDLVINGMELGTAYSEMADALEQRRRLTEQSLKAAAGDPEAMEIDEDFLYALETGLPPTGGLGIGVDRLVMLMTGTQIRGVLSFPFVKPAVR